MRLRAILAALLLLLPSLTVAQARPPASGGPLSDPTSGPLQLHGADLLLSVSAAAHPAAVGLHTGGESGGGVTPRGTGSSGAAPLPHAAPAAVEGAPTGARVRLLPLSGLPRGIHRGAWTTSTPPPSGTT
jgi:hypothetical protein